MAERKVEITVKAKAATKAAVKAVQGQLRALQRISSSVVSKMNTAFKGVKTTISSMGKVAVTVARTIKQNFLAVAVAITGIVLTIKKGIDSISEGAKIREQTIAFQSLAKSFGSDGNKIISSLKKVSDGTVSTMELIGSASRAMLLGIAPDKITKLMEIARSASKATGDTVAKSFEDISIGIGRQSKLILDNLGIIIKVEQANEVYAATLGKTASQLTDVEKRTAFLNATLAAGENIISRVSLQSNSTADAIAKLSAITKEANDKFKAMVAQSSSMNSFLNTLVEGFDSIKGSVGLSQDTLDTFIKNGIEKFIKVVAIAAKTGVVWKAILSAQIVVWRSIGRMIAWVIGKIKAFLGILGKIPLVSKAFKGLGDGIDKVGDSIPVLGEVVDSFKQIPADIQKVNDLVDKFGEKYDENIKKAKDNTEKLNKKIDEMAPIIEKAGAVAVEMSKDQKKALKETQKAYEDTALKIESTFSNILFARLTKRGVDFRDTMINIFRDIGDSIIRLSTDAVARSVLNFAGISSVGGFGGNQVVAGNRIVQTTAGGLASGAGIGGIAQGGRSPVSASSAVSAVGAGKSLSSSVGLKSAASIALAAGQGTLSPGGLSSPSSLIRLGGAGLGLAARTAFGGTGKLAGGFAKVFGRAGTRAIGGGLGLAGGIGSFAGGFAPGLLGFQENRGSSIGSSIGGIGGSIAGSALAGPIGAAAGGFIGSALGGIGGSLFGGKKSRPGLPFGATSFRGFGAIANPLSAQAKGAAGGVLGRAGALGIEENFPQLSGALSAIQAIPSSPQDLASKIGALQSATADAEKLLDTIETTLTGAVTSAIGEGFKQSTATAGFDVFKDVLNNSIFDSIIQAVTASLGNTTVLKSIMAKTVAPITEFLSKQGDVFDAAGFKSLTKEIAVSPDFAKASDLFTSVFEGLDTLSKGFSPDSQMSAAQAIRIPKLAQGGEITRSGLAFVDKGERFSGVNLSRLDFQGDRSSGITLNLNGAINLSSDQNIKVVGQKLGNEINLTLNKPIQFSSLK